jgi:hypothetical protein
MFGKGVNQEEEALLGNILRSINKKIDHTAHEGEGHVLFFVYPPWP